MVFTVIVCVLSVGIFSLGWAGFDFPGQSLQTGLDLFVVGLLYTVRSLPSPTRSLDFMCCGVEWQHGTSGSGCTKTGSLGDVGSHSEEC